MSSYLKGDDATISGNDFPTLLSFEKPGAGLPIDYAGLYLHDGSLGMATFLANRKPGGDPLVKIGGPATSGLGVSLIPSNGFETGIAETTGMTYISVMKPLVSTSAVVIISGAPASVGSTPNLSQLFWAASGGTSSLRISTRDGTDTQRQYPLPASNGTGNVNNWNTCIGAFDATEAVVGWGRDGVYSEVSNAITGRTVKPTTIRIAGTSNALYSATINVAMTAIYTRKLSSGERASAAVALREYFAQIGISTL